MKLIKKNHVEVSVRRATKKEFLMSLLGFAILALIIWGVVR